MDNKAFSLMEVIISVVILSLTVAGLANLFISAKRNIIYSRSKVAAAELGKYFLDPLRAKVRQDQWFGGGNCLTGDMADCPGVQTIDNTDYIPQYQITQVNPTADDPLGRLRRVKINISWVQP